MLTSTRIWQKTYLRHIMWTASVECVILTSLCLPLCVSNRFTCPYLTARLPESLPNTWLIQTLCTMHRTCEFYLTWVLWFSAELFLAKCCYALEVIFYLKTCPFLSALVGLMLINKLASLLNLRSRVALWQPQHVSGKHWQLMTWWMIFLLAGNYEVWHSKLDFIIIQINVITVPFIILLKVTVFCKRLFFFLFHSNLQRSPGAPRRHLQIVARHGCTLVGISCQNYFSQRKDWVWVVNTYLYLYL